MSTPVSISTPVTTPAATTRQLTTRAAIAGMLLGGFMSLSNLYVVLKTGWSVGVSITAGILAYAIFALLLKLKFTRTHFGILENNAMQSVASAAGYMTGGGTVAAIPALMMITGQSMGGWQMFAWISSIAFLGVIMAIPMKQQMINIEQLRFPSGIAAAETLKALHAVDEGADTHSGASNEGKAAYLGYGGIAGALVAFFRDAKASWMPFNLPDKIALLPSFVTLKGRPLIDYTISFEGSLILLGAGAIMGFRAAWSMLLGGIINFGIVAPMLY
jgi:OPT family oligopeptide transporter